MTFTNYKVAAIAAAVAASLSAQTHAAGFMLTEQSSGALGRAYAGVGVDGTDIAGMFYNPATLTLHEGTKFQIGFVQVGMNLDYAGDNGSTENGSLKSQTLPQKPAEGACDFNRGRNLRVSMDAARRRGL